MYLIKKDLEDGFNFVSLNTWHHGSELPFKKHSS